MDPTVTAQLPSDMADYIDAYLTHLRTRGRSDSTLTTYGWLLRRIDRELPYGLAQAHTDEIQDWIYAPKAGGKPRSAAATSLYRTIIREFFRWATDPRDPILDWDPTAYLPDPQPLPRRTPRPLTVEQLADILTRAKEPYRTWITLAAYAGLRCVEISRLDREHVTREHVWVHGKGGHERTVPAHPAVWASVKDLPPGPVARRTDGSRADRHHVNMSANMYLHRSLKLPDVTMHRFRKTFAQLTYEATGDIEVTRALLGHASVRTTQVYVRAASTAMVAAVAALPRLTSAAAASGAA